MVLKSNSLSALWGIGRVWWHRKSKKAISYAKRVYFLAKKTGLPTGLKAQIIGLCYKAVNNHKRAEYWLLRGDREGPSDSGTVLNLCQFYFDIGNLNKSVVYAKKLKIMLKHENKEFRFSRFAKNIEKFIAEVLAAK